MAKAYDDCLFYGYDLLYPYYFDLLQSIADMLIKPLTIVTTIY